MTKYQITTYDGTVHTIEGNTQQEVKRMVEFFGLMPVKMADGTTEMFAKGAVQHMKMIKDDTTLPPEQRLAMGDQKDNRSTGPEAEAAKAWRKYCGHDFKLMSDKRERQKFYDKQMKKAGGAWTNYQQ
jgi:hypothetical protein